MKTEKNIHKRIRRVFVSLFCIICMVEAPNFTLASADTFSEGYEINRIANMVDNVISDKNMLRSIYDRKTDFIPKTKATNILIPKKGSGKIALSIGEDDICMLLPKEVAKCSGISHFSRSFYDCRFKNR